MPAFPEVIECGSLFDLGVFISRPLQMQGNADDFDTGTVEFTIPGPPQSAFGYFSYGNPAPGMPGLKCVGIDPKGVNDGLTIVTCRYKGSFGNKPIKISFRAYPETTAGERIVIPTSAGQPVKAELFEPRIAISAKYIQLGQPILSGVGKEGFPPVVLEPPEFIWTSLADAIWIYPDGWILVNRACDNVAGTNIYLVEDEWIFYWDKKPGDI